jgi:hypothetical protein
MRLKKYLLISIFLAAWNRYPAQVLASGGSKESAPQSRQTVSATVCEIVKNGAAFDRKYLSVQAFVIGGIGHGFALADDQCSAGLSMDAPESVREHEDYLTFMRTVVEQGGGFTENSKSRLTARFYGLVKYHPKEHRKWVLDVERISEIEVKQNVNKAGGPL